MNPAKQRTVARRKPRLWTIFAVGLAAMGLAVVLTQAPWPVRVGAAMILLPLLAVLLTVQALRAGDPGESDLPRPAHDVAEPGRQDVAEPGRQDVAEPGRQDVAARDVAPAPERPAGP